MERVDSATRKTQTLGWVPFFAFAILPHPAPMFVCADCEFKTIQAAVTAAPPGAQLTIRAGRYPESGIVISRPLSIQGEGEAIVDGENRNKTLFLVQANQVSIRGLTLMNTGSSYTEELAGIRVAYSKSCMIEKNNFVNTTFGVYIEKSESCTIRENRFSGAALDDTSGGNGIHSWNGAELRIENNEISGHRDGIYLEFTKSSKIIGNTVSHCLRYGLHFMSANNNEYTDNLFTENGAGVAVMYSRNVVMRRNRFMSNRGSAAFGLLLKEIHTSVIENNQFTRNTVGIFMESSNRSQFKHNEFVSNGWALRIMADCEDNRFEANDFASNTFDAATNSGFNPNHFDGNYWSHYDGYDLDRDGAGDRPYRPVSLSSVILEKIESSYILIHSPLFSLLDDVERALPDLTPAAFKDDHPRMQPIQWKAP
mgnify:CR=1 FL=1